ncbi:MAG: outer membrane protein assembly factor [Desulfatitalea sp.]|nr:outer membrane protein assembly factor [Desulfatitalea sp.]
MGYKTQVGLVDPRLLGTRIVLNTGVYADRSEPFNQDFGTESWGGHVNFSRDWRRHFTFGLANRYERRQQFPRNAETAVSDRTAEDFDPRRIFVTTPTVQYDTRDDFIRPRRGWLSALSMDMSKGFDNNLDDFFKYRFDTRYYHPLASRVTLAARFWIGYLSPYGGDAPPVDQLFYLGGTSTVRGYEENLLRFDAEGKAVGGQLAMTANVETRIDIGRNFELIPFVDTGSVRQAQAPAGNDDLRWSAGLGVQYITPIGPMGLFYGMKIDPKPAQSNGQLHLSIGYTF